MSAAQKGSLLRKLEFKIGDIISELKASGKVPNSALVMEKVQKIPEYNRIAKNTLASNIETYFEKFVSSNKEDEREEEPKKPSKNDETLSNSGLNVGSSSNPANSSEKIDDKEKKPEKIKRKKPSNWDADDETYMNDLIRKKLITKPSQNTDFINNTPDLEDLGGIESVLPIIDKAIYSPLKNYELFKKLNCLPPRGVLLTGSPGSGKTVLALAICKNIKKNLSLPFFYKSATEIIGGLSGESEQNIRNLFEEAKASAPCLIFIDEIDAIAGRRDQASKEMERRVISQLLLSLDSLPENVFVISATSRPDHLEPALRRSGRFDKEISLTVPDEKNRLSILSALTKSKPLDPTINLSLLAKLTPGYVPSDLEALVREASLFAVDRYVEIELKSKGETVQKVETTLEDEKADMEVEAVSNVILEKEESSYSFSWEDFEKALKCVQPTAKREGFAVVPDVSWDDIGALIDLKKELESSLILPILHPEKFSHFNISAPAGVLLYGPPGCGKTLLAKAVANASQANFIAVKGPELLNKYVGESEKAVRSVFSRARTSAPCIIFFDELDALCPKRGSEGNAATERVVNQLLTELDGLESRKQVFIIAATNRPDIIDTAMLRPGRLDKLLYVPLPTKEDRLSILEALTRKTPLAENIDLKNICFDERLEGFSGADMAALVKEAGLKAILEELENINFEHFEYALSKITPSLSEKEKKKYEILQKNLRSVRSVMKSDI